MNAYTGVKEQIQSFLTSALHGGEWARSRLNRFTPWEGAPGTHWIGGSVGPRAGLILVRGGNFQSLKSKDSSTIEPTVYSLYGLRYPADNFFVKFPVKF
jgi:hypothetical protein